MKARYRSIDYRLSTIDYRLLCGQSLIEVIISAGISVVLAIALISTVLVVQKSAREAKNSTEATKLAQAQVEKMRVFRDRLGFDKVVDGSCLRLSQPDDLNPQTWFLDASSCQDKISSTNFWGNIKVSTIDANNKLVTIYIGWDEAGGQKSISSQTILSRWDLTAPSPGL